VGNEDVAAGIGCHRIMDQFAVFSCNFQAVFSQQGGDAVVKADIGLQQQGIYFRITNLVIIFCIKTDLVNGAASGKIFSFILVLPL
jgi:uncharacterized membrane protein YfbV (UPF0208 family)